ncbi:MAG: FAD-binding oxidoreductase, partial [Pseudomonadota bacterium]|nr:FAD-binding oxidoreductase [Pseudomonadota bacterium]
RKHMDELIDRSEEWKQSGYHHNLELVDENQVKKYVNSDSYVGGLIDSGSGHIHPLNLCLGEAKAASELGVMIYEDTHAVKISGGSPSKVATENGIIESDYIVIATNAYIGDLNKKLRRMVMPAASCIIATEPLSNELAEKVIPSDMAVCDQNTILDYYRLSADKRMLFGGRFNYSGKIPSDDKIKIEIKKRMVSVFPELSEARVDYAWSGNVAVSLKKIPQLGRIDNNILYSQGYSGHGVAPTHMAAKVIADAIDGDDEVLNTLSSVNHIQLPGGKWFSSPATAIGMMYYQLKDKIANFSR